MTIDKLIEAAKTCSRTPEAIEAFKERCKERAKEEQEWADSQKITGKWLRREYNI